MGYVSGRIAGVGLMLSLAGVVGLWSAISHQLNGVEATATVLAHVGECRVEYQLVVSDHRTDLPMDCDAATTFQKRMGDNKVILHRNDFAKLRFTEPGGQSREVKALEANLGAHNAPVGSKIPIVYDPAHPEDSRAPTTMGAMGGFLGLSLFGLFLTFAGFGMGPTRIFKALTGGSRGAAKPAVAGIDWSEEAVGERLRAAAAQAASGPSSPSPWQSPSAASSDAPVASPWAATHSQPQFGRAAAPTFGKRRA